MQLIGGIFFLLGLAFYYMIYIAIVVFLVIAWVLVGIYTSAENYWKRRHAGLAR